MPDRLLHRGAQPGPEAVVVALGRRALVFGASVPDRRLPARAGLGHPSESPVDQSGDAGGIQGPTHARDLQQLVLMRFRIPG